MSKDVTVLSILTQSSQYLEKQEVPFPRLVAEQMIAYILKMKRLYLYVEYNRPLIESELSAIRQAMIRRGRDRQPMEYIFNSALFYQRDFYVDQRVLIPRIETELLVERAIERLKGNENATILEIGIGSGAIGLTLALELPHSKVLGVDISCEAIEVAEKNLHQLGVKNCKIFQSDCFSEISSFQFDMIISNPPYIGRQEGETLPKETLQEPEIALFAENNGLALYEKIISQAKEYLVEGGWLFFEIGYQQGEALMELFHHYGFLNGEIHKDYFGHPRMAIAQK